MSIQHQISIEIGSEDRILQLQRELIVILMRIHCLNLILNQTGNGLKLLSSLVYQLCRILRMDNLADVSSVVVAVDIHDIIYKLKRISKKIFSLIHNELIVTHATIGL